MSCDDLTRAQAGNNGIGGVGNATSDWELITVLEGVVESTGMTTQARSSYLPSGKLICEINLRYSNFLPKLYKDLNQGHK